MLATSLDQATSKVLDMGNSPWLLTGEIDNRGCLFYLDMYWAEALAAQTQDTELQSHFAPLAESLAKNEAKIVDELNSVQGKKVDIGGYYMADAEKTKAVMRPSATLNAVLATVQS